MQQGTGIETLSVAIGGGTRRRAVGRWSAYQDQAAHDFWVVMIEQSPPNTRGAAQEEMGLSVKKRWGLLLLIEANLPLRAIYLIGQRDLEFVLLLAARRAVSPGG